jgi:hypothetical protein
MQIADKTGIRKDLETVFGGNRSIVDDILTLAMFPYVTKFSFNRVARWQKIAGAPSARDLTPAEITRLTQSITERHRMKLLELRAARLGKEELCAVDSTSRSAWGGSLADIHWGKNSEGLPLEQTTEAVVYTLSSHLPVYYRTFPGNMSDSGSLGVILSDLEHAGFKDLVLITDRGYNSLRNLENYILRGQSMVMAVKAGQREVAKAIRELGEFGACPDGMKVDPDAKLYHKQIGIDYEVKNGGQAPKMSDRLRLNLYFDPVRRGSELMRLDISLSRQEAALGELLAKGGSIGADAGARRDFRYFKITCDPDTGRLLAFAPDAGKVASARRFSGFYAIISHGVNFGAMETYRNYRLRDEQEKYFQQMKDQMGADRQRNWSEDGKTGRLFILFVSLVLGSQVRHIWGSTGLRDLFSTSLDVLDEMRSIRLIERLDGSTMITPFTKAQVQICEAFGYEFPEGCAPAYVTRWKTGRKRGRPKKNG